jgi:transcriptional regulator with XRE-family HTH domain
MSHAPKKTPTPGESAREQNRKPVPDELEGLAKRVKDKLAEYKKDKISISRLAESQGLYTNEISEVAKNKKIAGITAAKLIRIAKALQVDPGWLLTGNEPNLAPIIILDPNDPLYARLRDVAQLKVDQVSKSLPHKRHRARDDK